MDEDLEAGDRVRSKQGGPVMTVAEKLGEGRVRCTWSEKGQPRAGEFAQDALERVASLL